MAFNKKVDFNMAARNAGLNIMESDPVDLLAALDEYERTGKVQNEKHQAELLRQSIAETERAEENKDRETQAKSADAEIASMTEPELSEAMGKATTRTDQDKYLKALSNLREKEMLALEQEQIDIIQKAYPFKGVRSQGEEAAFFSKLTKGLIGTGIADWKIAAAIRQAKDYAAKNSGGRLYTIFPESIINQLRKSGDLGKLVEKTKTATAPKAKKESGKIEDFGEVLQGARKHYSQEVTSDLTKEVDFAAEPLSKIWPLPDYQKLVAGGMPVESVSIIRALRDMVENKPRGRGLPAWVKDTESLRTIAAKLTSGEKSIDDTRLSIRLSSGGSKIRDLADLYDAVGHEISLEGAQISHGEYFYKNGVKLEKSEQLYSVGVKGLRKSMFVNWPTIDIGYGKTRAEAIEDFKKNFPAYLEKLKGKEVSPKQMKLGVYRKTIGQNKGRFFIGHKIRSTVLELKFFDTVKEAYAYIESNRADLEAMVEERKKPITGRREENLPRSGKDIRAGKDVTPDDFSTAFGFRGVQFGNWVEGSRRQTDINEAYEALMDLAESLSIPPSSLSLNGKLGLAFGARGRGAADRGAAAHYEADGMVINLTKVRGAGSLAHEWFHGLDDYLGRGEYGTTSSYLSSDTRKNSTARPEIIEAFGNLMKTIENTGLPARSKELDSTKSKDYWSTNVEMAARSFESYIIRRLDKAGVRNDFLVNIISESKDQDENGSFPYILESEIPTVVDAFDNLFNSIKQEKTDKGIKLYSVEYLVAKYAAAGVQKAASVIREGARMFASGVTKFADWAKGMLKQFGSKIGKQLRSMYADLQAFNQRLGKEGM
ncbi:MAG: hypothetical protein EOM80_17100, partial [Erysipelotrichia bacterium]|nr:hypothetical protein [Erysipelotrichia bacterium]